MAALSNPSLRARHRFVVACAVLALALGACVHPQYGAYGPGPRAQLGAMTGAAAGGLIGAAASDGAAVPIVAGVLLGGLLGGALGDSMDRADEYYASESAYRGLESYPSGRTSSWHNPDSGHAGSLTPTYTYDTARGPCREFSQTIEIGRRSETAYGTACRDEYGYWDIVR